MNEDRYEPLPAKRYCIYARSSADEKSGKQYKSIPDQLQFCRELASKERIVVGEKYVFTEMGSAKTADNRPVFNKMLTLIRSGEIDGIISWHPDRLSRNMLEAGIIIDLIDLNSINDLKFCTHHFENNASGKMMLGIMFAISKEYSDKLSINVSRGHETNFDQGKSVGSYKWGYHRRISDGFYEPHDKLFAIVRRIWQMRLQAKPYAEILAWIKQMGVSRTVESKDRDGNITINTYTITRSTLMRMFHDPLYYGVLRQHVKGRGIELKDLRTLTDFEFTPLVTEEEWKEVQQVGRSKVRLRTKQQFPFRANIVHCKCGAECYPTTGQSDYEKQLYLYLVCRDSRSHRERKEKPTVYRMRSKILINAIAEKLKTDFKPTPLRHEKYARVMKSAVESDLADACRKRANVTRKLTEAEGKLDKLVVDAIGKSLDATERGAYERRKFSLEEDITQHKADLKNLDQAAILQTFSYEEFSNFLRNADLYWKKADAEQKHQLARFLFSNVVVGNEKVLTLAYKPLIRDLFVIDGGSGGI